MNIRDVLAKAIKSGKEGNANILDRLASKGSNLIEEAYKTGHGSSDEQWKNESYNMHDAYGYAVYYNGKMKRSGFLKDGVLSRHSHKGYKSYPSGTGREYVENLIKDYKPSKKGYSLIVFNAAFYVTYLEDGVGLLQRKYQVLSQIAGDMEKIAESEGGEYRKVGNDG